MQKNDTSPLAGKIVEHIKKLHKKLGKIPDKNEFLEATKIPEWQIRKFFGGWQGALTRAGFEPASIRIAQLQRENGRLQSALEEANEHSINSSAIRSLIHGCNEIEFGDSGWIRGPRKRSSRTNGTPTLFLSDIHFDEVVRPEQVEYVNEYNHEIAVRRIKHTFQRSLDLLKGHFAAPKYDGMVVALGGDMLSGNIHEELAESNQQRILKSVVDLTDLLIEGIGGMADAFGKVFVPCVVGNHGRIHKKPRAKFRVQDNYEWLVYQYLIKHFRSDGRVSFLLPESADAQFALYDLNFLLTHGDQFKGGGGVSGVFAPLMTGMARKQKRQQTVKRAFDIMMMGHWHQYIHTESLLINGSIKGYDEYAYISNFGFERPQQALFVTHPEKAVTFRMPVLCDRKKA